MFLLLYGFNQTDSGSTGNIIRDMNVFFLILQSILREINLKTIWLLIFVANAENRTMYDRAWYLRGLTMDGGELGNQVSTSLTTRIVLYRFKKLLMPFATANPANESPGRIATKLWDDTKLECGTLGSLKWTCKIIHQQFIKFNLKEVQCDKSSNSLGKWKVLGLHLVWQPSLRNWAFV